MTLSDIDRSAERNPAEHGDDAAHSGVHLGGHDQARKAVGMVLALTAGLSLILALFVSIAVNSGPAGIRLAVAGPAPAVEQITAALEPGRRPGRLRRHCRHRRSRRAGRPCRTGPRTARSSSAPKGRPC